MATVKHIKVKNNWYSDAVRYLKYRHDEYTNKPILDENGALILRDFFLMDGVLCSPESFGMECIQTNAAFGKNTSSDEIKAHHYIVSFDPRDREENGLSCEMAQALGLELTRRAFPGHQAIVCTHPDGHNGAGNIHVHIVINSVRKEAAIDPLSQEKQSLLPAGYKHNASHTFMAFFKQQVIDLCQRDGLYQVDLLNPAKVCITDKEYWAQRRGQHDLDETAAAQVNPNESIFETFLGTLRRQISSTLDDSRSLEEFREKLFENYGITLRESRGCFSYLLPDRERPIRARRLGTDFDKGFLLSYFRRLDREARSSESAVPKPAHGAKKTDPSIRLIVDLQSLVKACENPNYARKVKISNLKEMSKTLAFLQENRLGAEADLQTLLAETKADLHEKLAELKATEKSLDDTNLLIRNVGQYLANKSIYSAYLKAGSKQDFREAHSGSLALYEAARKQLRELTGEKSIPSLKELKAQKAALLQQKNEQYAAYSFARSKLRELQTVAANVETMLGVKLSPEPSPADRTK